MHLIKNGAALAYKSLGLDCPAGNASASSLQLQVPRVPRGDINQPHREEKGWQARRRHPRVLRIQGGATFSIASALEALDPAWNGQDTLSKSCWLAGPS